MKIIQIIQHIILAALLVVGLTPARAASDEGTVSGDSSLNESMQRYRHPLSDCGAWHNPYMPASSADYLILAASVGAGATLVIGGDRGESGDELLMRSVSVYTRAMLDRGGWENPFVRASHYASGNALLAARQGEGVTAYAGGPKAH